MRIAEIAAFKTRIPLKGKIRHASHARELNDTLIVRCTLADGTQGWGEGLPRPYVTGETIETALDQFSQTNWPKQLTGDIASLAEAVSLCDRIQLAGTEHDLRGCFGNSVRCAIELSILDAFARWEGVPLSRVTDLVAEAEPIRQHVAEARYSAAITSMGAIGEITRACKIDTFNFAQAKVKVGVPGRNDKKTIQRIRWILGPDVDIRIDANEAWTCENLQKKLAPLLPYNISSVEQPVRHEDVEGLGKLRGKIGSRLMLDESLCCQNDAKRAVELGLCDLFNLRISKCGGYVNSIRLAAFAHRHGLGYQLGCQVGESGILSAAGRHFATSIGGLAYIEGSFDRFLLRETLIKEDITFGYGGWSPALPRPGLGITVDLESLKRVTVSEQRVKI